MTVIAPYAETADAKDLLRELEVDALNWARTKHTKLLRREYRRLLNLRQRYPRQFLWERYKLAAAYQVLTQERGLLLPPVPVLLPGGAR